MTTMTSIILATSHSVFRYQSGKVAAAATSCGSHSFPRNTIVPAVFQIHRSWKSTAVAAGDKDVPTLTIIPTLPYAGSYIPAYSGTPQYSHKAAFEFWPEMRRRFGDFYRMGMPLVGAGADGRLHVIQDPVVMARLLRQEGQYPFGTAELAWPPALFFQRHHSPSQHLIGTGPAWKRMRLFAQKDLLGPKSAQRYLPAALEAARQSSKGAPLHCTRFNEYLNLVSFEMFVNIMLGHLPNVANPSPGDAIDQEDIEFCAAVVAGLRTNSLLMYSPYHKTMVTTLGIETALFKKFDANWLRVYEISNKKVKDLKEVRDTGKLTLTQENSYINQAFNRQAEQDDITVEEAMSLAAGLIAGGVDTTGNMMRWRILHVAMHPKVQEEMYKELIQQVDGKGQLTEEAMSPSNSPYLHAFMRESHRCGNASPLIPIKRFETEIEVHGVELPPGSVVAFDSYSTGMDPKLVENPTDFRPQRFLPDAVEARKGTPSEVIDNAFFSGPFSQGARRCPGSRVANLEAYVFLAQLVLDWKMSIPSLSHWSECPYDMETLFTPNLPPIDFTPRK